MCLPSQITSRFWRKISIFAFWTLLFGVSLGQDPFLAGGNRPADNSRSQSPKAYLRQNEFYIPYQLTDSSDANSALNLYVSKNYGQNWELYKSLIPANEKGDASKQFNVRVGNDGEYWFAIRPSRVENRPQPQLGPRPDLKIIIDTDPPKMKIETQKTAPNQLTVYWTMTDKCPDPESVKFFQRYSETAQWQPVGINPRATVNQEQVSTGQFTIDLPERITRLFLKGEAADKAKTPTVVLWNIPLDGTPVVLPGETRQSITGFTNAGKGEFKSAFLGDEEKKAESAVSESGSLPSDTNPRPATASSIPDWSPVREDPASYSNESTTNRTVNNSSPMRVDRKMMPRPAVDLSHAMIINTPKFDLDYEITSVGRSGVGSVELWYTKDQGATWSVLAVDKDNITPISVELQEDGIYGLKMVIKNGAGLGGVNPRSGENPASWLILDRMVPTGELKSADIRIDSNIPQMRLRWTSTDQYPAANPVSLYWSRDGQAPWSLIADQLPASSDYLWNMPSDVPPRIIVKMEIIDKAGNHGTYVSPPIAADASTPRGFIRDIRSVD